MFGNLFLEMKKRKITQTEVAKTLNITINGFRNKLLGKTDFNSEEMFSLQEKYFPDLEIKYLFEQE